MSIGFLIFIRFVRYATKSALFRAVSELNRWELNGMNLVVDISQDTAKKIKRGK